MDRLNQSAAATDAAPAPEQRRWFSVRQTSKRLPGKRSDKYVYAQIRAGRLKAIVLDRRGTFAIADAWIDEFLASCPRASAGKPVGRSSAAPDFKGSAGESQISCNRRAERSA